MFTRNWIMPLLGAALLLACLPRSAAAAPQILALLATGEAVPLHCEDGACAGQFSGFCLQRERPDPQPGATYRAQGDTLTLVLTGGDGAVRRMPAGEHVTISTKRGYTAVEISLPEALLQEWGAGSVALEVGETVALAPIPTAGDANPQSEADIALAAGPQRTLGARIMAESPGQSGAVRLTNTMINALPRHGRIGARDREGLWDRVAAPRAASYPREAVDGAHAVYRKCIGKVARGQVFNLRQCLEAEHDSIMLDLNIKYWEAGPES